MSKKSDKKHRFKGAVSRNAEKQQKGAQFGHLNLPKNFPVFNEEPKSTVKLDIIPYEVSIDNHPDRDEEYGIAVKNSLWYKRPYWLHRNIGATNESVICPTSINQKCPICEYRAKLLKDGADWKDETVKTLKPSMRNLYLVIPIGDKKYPEEIHLWDISQFCFQDSLNEEIQENEENETFPDLEEGYTLRIRFSEESFANNKYAKVSRIDFLEREEIYEEDIIKKEDSLDNFLSMPSYKTLEALFFGGLSQDEIEDEEEDDEEEEMETRQKIHRRKKTTKKEEEEEEDEPPFDEEEDEEQKTPPKQKTTSRTKKSTKTDSKDKCPSGHRFGTDCEKFDECDDCDLWEDCIDASEQ